MIYIEINKFGKVISDKMKGWFIIIKDDLENTGGYLVILSEDNKFSKNGYDNWFLNLKEVEQYLLDNKFEIEWFDDV